MKTNKLKKIKMHNFRCIEDAEIDCTQSNIIALLGNNESGKTTVLKAVGTVLINENGSPYGYCRGGTNEFLNELEFDDGTRIIRERKFKPGKIKENGDRVAPTSLLNRYAIVTPDGQMQEWLKLDKETPPIITEELDVFAPQGEDKAAAGTLQVRSYEDSLLFANTSAGTNYRLLYEALKTTNLKKAIALGKKAESDKIKYIDGLDAKYDFCKNDYDQIQTIDVSNIEMLLSNVEKGMANKNSVERVIDKLVEKENIKIYDQKIDQIDTTIFKKLRQVYNKVSEQKEIEQNIKKYDFKDNSKKFDKEIYYLCRECNKNIKQKKEIEQEFEQCLDRNKVVEEIEQKIGQILKDKNIKTFKCSACGKLNIGGNCCGE